MPFPNEHAARIVMPEDMKEPYARKTIEKGIDIVLGTMKDTGKMEIQAYRFNATHYPKPDKKFHERVWSVAEAKKWLSDHKIKYISFTPAGENDMADFMNLSILNKTEDETEINIDGVIGWDDEASWKGIKEKLTNVANSKAKRIIVNINSFGGFVSDGLMIHDALKMSKAEIETRVFSMTASAATIIAQAGDKRKMSTNSLYLIHHAMNGAQGNVNDMKSAVDDLEKVDARILDIYLKNSKNKEKVKELFDENNGYGKWIDADEALEAGLIDEIIEPSKAAAIADKEFFNKYHLPEIPEEMSKILDLLTGKKDEKPEEEKETPENKIEETIQKPEEIPAEPENKEVPVDLAKEVEDLKAEIIKLQDEISGQKTNIEDLNKQLSEAHTKLVQASAPSSKVEGPVGRETDEVEKIEIPFADEIKALDQNFLLGKPLENPKTK